MTEYKLTTLSDGIRVMTIPKLESPSAVAMVLVGVGSRYEEERLQGISHFIEHNVFKGTTKRPKRGQIAETVEGLGGETNAATGFEYTYYYAKSAPVYFDTMLDVVMDISVNMTFPSEDVEIERGNVLEEIRLTKDTPTRRLLKEYCEFIWGKQAVGRDIAGTEVTVGSITKTDMHKFVGETYTKDNILIVVAGHIDPDIVTSQIENFYSSSAMNPKKMITAPGFNEFQKSPGVMLVPHKSEQTHLCLGVKTFGKSDKRRFALDLLNVVLGEGMSSRLHKKVRDDLGLAYYVGSGNWELIDTGVWFIRAGVDTKRVEQAIKVLLGELRRLMSDLISKEEFDRAKAYVKGGTLLGVETSDDLASWYGFQALTENEILSPVEYCKQIDALTRENLRDVASEILRNDRINIGILGPFENASEFQTYVKLDL